MAEWIISKIWSLYPEESILVFSDIDRNKLMLGLALDGLFDNIHLLIKFMWLMTTLLTDETVNKNNKKLIELRTSKRVLK